MSKTIAALPGSAGHPMHQFTGLVSLALASLLPLSAVAEDANKPAVPQAGVTAQTTETAEKLVQPLQLATLLPANETPKSGDIVHVQRAFGTWILLCDTQLSTNKRLCSIEQRLEGETPESRLTWRIMQTDGGSPALVVIAPKNLDLADGIRMDFGLEKTLRDFSCKTSCIGLTRFDGDFQNALLKASSVSFTFTLKGAAPGQKVVIPAPLKGLTDAIAAAGTDPFGKNAQQQTAAGNSGKSKPAAKPPAKPKAKPQKQPQQKAEAAPGGQGLY